MRAKLESTIISLKSRESNVIVSVESEVNHEVFNKEVYLLITYLFTYF